jgi:hypothetical protein
MRAPQAVYELIDLLRLAQSAIDRAQIELQGDVADLASRLSRQVTYLRGVSELLEHEATRPTTCGAQSSTGAFAQLEKQANPGVS